MQLRADAGKGTRQQVLNKRVIADPKVHQGGGGSDGGAEARFGQLCGQVEAEVLVAKSAAIAEEDHAWVCWPRT